MCSKEEKKKREAMREYCFSDETEAEYSWSLSKKS